MKPSLVAVRMDKWLWAVRIFKTRTQAAEACRRGHVIVGSQPAKPSRHVRVGETLVIRTGEMIRTLKVLDLLEQRVSAEIARNFCDDQTPAEEYSKPRERHMTNPAFRPKGRGRPTKKDRRRLDSFL